MAYSVLLVSCSGRIQRDLPEIYGHGGLKRVGERECVLERSLARRLNGRFKRRASRASHGSTALARRPPHGPPSPKQPRRFERVTVKMPWRRTRRIHSSHPLTASRLLPLGTKLGEFWYALHPQPPSAVLRPHSTSEQDCYVKSHSDSPCPRL